MGCADNVVQPGARAQDRLEPAHFDLRAFGSMQDEVRRLKANGARVLRRDAGLVTKFDPEANEFCIRPGPA